MTAMATKTNSVITSMIHSPVEKLPLVSRISFNRMGKLNR